MKTKAFDITSVSENQDPASNGQSEKQKIENESEFQEYERQEELKKMNFASNSHEDSNKTVHMPLFQFPMSK